MQTAVGSLARFILKIVCVAFVANKAKFFIFVSSTIKNIRKDFLALRFPRLLLNSTLFLAR